MKKMNFSFLKEKLFKIWKKSKAKGQKSADNIKKNTLSDILSMLFVFYDDSVYYVNGTQTLPPPLSPTEEAKLLCELGKSKERDEQIRNILVERNLRLVVYLAKKFENTNIGLEDLVSIGTIGLMKAINTYDVEKNIKLATYASRCIENEILMYIRKNSPTKNEVSLDEPLNIDWDGNELLLSDILGTEPDTVHRRIEEEEDKKIVLVAVENLPERDREIINMRFGLDKGTGEKTQKEVADIMGISQSYISRLEKKIIAQLRKDIFKYFMI